MASTFVANRSPSLRASLLKYVHAFMIQTTHWETGKAIRLINNRQNLRPEQERGKAP
jgi:hypothetical protein